VSDDDVARADAERREALRDALEECDEVSIAKDHWFNHGWHAGRLAGLRAGRNEIDELAITVWALKGLIKSLSDDINRLTMNNEATPLSVLASRMILKDDETLKAYVSARYRASCEEAGRDWIRESITR
jgi:hypothetical protein